MQRPTPRRPCRLVVRSREAAEEAVFAPGGARGIVGHSFEQPKHDAIEARGGFGVDRLSEIVGGLVVAVADPVLARGFVRRALLVAELEGQRRDAAADEAVLVAAGEAVL